MPFTRRRLITRAARTSGGLVVASTLGHRALTAAPARAAVPPLTRLGAPPLRDADYLALAERAMRHLNRTWRRDEGAYSSGGGGIDVIYNAALLTVHAVAAAQGHEGRARNDDRARVLVDRLCASPPYFTGGRGPARDQMFHAPGWVSDLGTLDSHMDKAIDPKVAEGLFAAWRARDVLALPPDVVARITDRIDGVARARFFRYPNVRLNQINWNAELYAYAAAVTGDNVLLRSDYRRHVRRFVAGVRKPLRRDEVTNLGPSYRFTYLPNYPGDPKNVDSAEYANITLHFLIQYEQALEAGMEPLPEDDMAILRAWAERVQFGYWMHSGMLNWDSGLGFDRWMKSKTWAYAQQGLLALARARRFHRFPRQGEWAKHVFDQGLLLYEELLVDLPVRRLPSPHLYGVTAAHQGVGSQRLFTARMAANAMRALSLGLGGMDAEPPPPSYAFDADIGRLAVSTRRYAAAIITDNQRAFPYGGIELARFFDGAGQPVGGLGGRPPASFGVVVRSGGGRALLASQTSAGGPRSLALTRSPQGAVARVRRLARDPDAGPFGELEAVGRARGRHAEVVAVHRFTASFIETTWRVGRRGRRRSLTVEALFPSWGADAAIDAVRRDGTSVRLAPGGPAVSTADVAYFHLAGPRGGYVVVCPEAPALPAGAKRVARQASAPRPGPTLVIRLARGSGFAAAVLRARIAPAADADGAREVAGRLMGG